MVEEGRLLTVSKVTMVAEPVGDGGNRWLQGVRTRVGQASKKGNVRLIGRAVRSYKSIVNIIGNNKSLGL